MRKVLLVLGIVLGIVVAIGIFLFVQMTRPVLLEVPVAIGDIPAGSVLHADYFRITRIANLDQDTASQWVLVNNWNQLAEGKLTTSEIRAGFPVARAQIDPNAPEGIENRLSLVLTGTNEYYYVLPTNPSEVGSYLQPGDRIDLIVNLGGEPKGDLVLGITQTKGLQAGVEPEGNTPDKIVLTQTIALPVTKLLMQNMYVMRIDRSAPSNSNQPQPEGARSTGDIKRLYIKVTRDQLEVLSFVLNVGKRNFAIRAATGSQDSIPTDGVTWDDFVRWFYAQRGNNALGPQPFTVISPYAQRPTPTPDTLTAPEATAEPVEPPPSQ
jgi:Flp pilus assembly protein CpaB